jgi:hypothetical protein
MTRIPKQNLLKPMQPNGAINSVKTNHLSPKYINVKVKGNNPQNINKRQAAIRYTLNQELKFYIKRNKKNQSKIVYGIFKLRSTIAKYVE